jgi:hypothetical protein
MRSFGLCQSVFVGVMFIADLDLCDLGFKAFSCSVNALPEIRLIPTELPTE